MMRLLVRLLVTVLAALGAFACGGDGGGSDDPNAVGLGVRVQWASLAEECGSATLPSQIPEAVEVLRILVTGEDGERCCVKIDPDSDALDGERHVTLTGFPEGDVTVDVTGYVGEIVPDAGATSRCTIKQPVGLGEDCDAAAPCAQSSYALAQPVTTRLRKGRETTVAACEIARPYFISATPGCDQGAPGNPVAFSNVVVTHAATECLCVGDELVCDGRAFGPQFEVVEKGVAAGLCSRVAVDPVATPIPIPRPVASARPVCCRADSACVGVGCCTVRSTALRPLFGWELSFGGPNQQPGCAELRVRSGPSVPADPNTWSFEVPTPTPTVTPEVVG